MKNKRNIVWLSVMLSWYQAAYCEDMGSVLQSKLNAIRTMQASFQQVVHAKHRELSHASGTMALSRPGRFRWQTIRPMAQLVVADGRRIWVYDPDLEQVTVKKQDKGVGGTAALFLSGYDDTVTRDFSVTSKTVGNKMYFDLHSKSSKANFQQMKLVFMGNTLCDIELFDQLGQHTTVHLSQIKTNLALPAARFQFKPPKGVDVVEQ